MAHAAACSDLSLLVLKKSSEEAFISCSTFSLMRGVAAELLSSFLIQEKSRVWPNKRLTRL